MNSIETKNINIAYGNVNIVEDLNLEIPKGKITTIIGANGCGKSTILKTIARSLKAKSGDIYINSKNINEQSSKEIARKMAVVTGKPKMSAQAVGGAVGHNPISIIIPCHRVVGTNGSLTGYAGGIDVKIKLLTLEGADMKRLFIPKKGTAL